MPDTKHDRRHFLSTAAMTLAATQLAAIASVGVGSGS